MKISWIVSGFSVLALLAACSDDTGTGASGGSGGAGGAGGSGAGASGGAGGSGGSGGSGGAGPGGSGGGSTCIAPADAPFTLETDALCIVSVFDAPNLALAAYGATPTWGRHGGPLTLSAMGEDLTLSRWSATGSTLSATESSASAAGLPEPAYWSAQINDFLALNGDLSVTAWTGANFDTQGELVTLEGNMSGQSTATGVFGIAVVGSRVFYTGLSAADGPTNNVPGLYAADFESIATGFDTSFLVDGFGLGSGPVAVDQDGRVFALMVDYIEGTQEARSYPATIATSAAPMVGTTLFELPGFGDALAAVTPSVSEPGLLVYQPNATDGSLAETIAQAYDASGAAVGTPETFLTLSEPDTNITLMTDDDGRLWIGVDGGASSTFYVLARP